MKLFSAPLFALTGLAAFAGSLAFSPAMAQDETAQPEAAAEEAAPIGILGARLGYSSTNGAVAGLSFRADKIGNTNASLQFAAEASRDDRTISFSFGLPPASPDRGSFGLNLYRNEAKATSVFGFETQSFGANPYWARSINENSGLTIGVDVSRDEISNIGAGASALITADGGARTKTQLDVEYDYATENTLAKISAGLISSSTSGRSLRVEGAVTNSWTQPDAPVQLVTTLSFGNLTSLTGNTHIGDRFILGQGLVRGFEYGGFGPRDLAAGNAALGGNTYAGLKIDALFPNLLPNQENLVLGGFYDAGSLWGLDSTAGGVAGANPVDDGRYLRSSVGIGARYKLGAASLNLYLSKPLQKQSYDRESTLQFSINANF